MVSSAKKIILKSADWFLYTFLTEKQKKMLSNLFSDKQKEKVKEHLKIGKKRSQMLKVNSIKYRLYTLGFTEKGLAELKEIVTENHEDYMKKLAAWELALWNANQYSEEGARNCLHYLALSTKDEKDPDILRKTAILKAESYDILCEIDEAKAVITQAFDSQKHADLNFTAYNLVKESDIRFLW